MPETDQVMAFDSDDDAPPGPATYPAWTPPAEVLREQFAFKKRSFQDIPVKQLCAHYLEQEFKSAMPVRETT